MIADDLGIAHGHLWGADLCFLIAVILAALAALGDALPARRVTVAEHPAEPPRTWNPRLYTAVLGWAALALVGLGLLIL